MAVFGGIDYVDRPNIGICKVCDEPMFFDEDMTVDQIKIHKSCFKCGICDYPLQIGYCARDPAMEGRYGLFWYCNLEHMLWGPGRKAAEMDKLGRGKKNRPGKEGVGSPTSETPGGLGGEGGVGGVAGAGGVGGAADGAGGLGGVASGAGAEGAGGGSTEGKPQSLLDIIRGRGGAGGAGAEGGAAEGVGAGGVAGAGAGGGPGAEGTAGVGAAGGTAGGLGGLGSVGAAGAAGQGAAGGTVAAGAASEAGAVAGAGAAGAVSAGAPTVISQATPIVGKCKVCDQPIAMCDDVTVDRITIHRNCFKCGICDSKLFPGSCARDQSLEARWGLKWYCGIHMMLGPGKKADEMEKAGKQKRFSFVKKLCDLLQNSYDRCGADTIDDYQEFITVT